MRTDERDDPDDECVECGALTIGMYCCDCGSPTWRTRKQNKKYRPMIASVSEAESE